MTLDESVPGAPLNTEHTHQLLSDLRDLSSALLKAQLSGAGEPDMAALVSASSPLFAQLKALNRQTYNASKHAKANVVGARARMDKMHLGLQNLVYEREYLEGEIKRCKEFRSIYQDVDIHSLEDFLRLAPEDLRKEEAMSDPHQLMLNRLQFELDERQRLERVKKDLLTEKAALTKENREKKAQLEELDRQLDQLVQNAKAVQSGLAQDSS